MNFLRRIYLLLVSLLLIIVVTALLLSPETVISWVGSISEITPLIRILLAVVFGLLLLALMYIQIRPDPLRNMSGLMMRGSGAVTEVSIESARERILKAVSEVPDVISAEADVKPINGKADIELQVVVFGHDVKLPTKQKEINRALKQVIDKQLGLRMAGQPRIHIRLQGRESSKPATASPPPVVVPPVMVEKEPLPSVPAPQVVESPKEPEPEVEQDAGSLFGGWRLGGDRKDEEVESGDATIELPSTPAIASEDRVIKPAETSVTSVPEPDDEDEDDLPSPSLASLLSDSQASKEDTSTKELPAEPVIVTVNDEKSLKFDLDEELALSDTDDFTDDDLPDGEKSDAEPLTGADNKEDRPPLA